jgi:hypothetical protein
MLMTFKLQKVINITFTADLKHKIEILLYITLLEIRDTNYSR